MVLLLDGTFLCFFNSLVIVKGEKKNTSKGSVGKERWALCFFFFFTKFPFINFKSIQIIWEILNRELFCLLLICFVNFSVNCSHLANHIPYKHSFHCITLFVFTLIVFADAIFIYVLWFECTGTAFFFSSSSFFAFLLLFNFPQKDPWLIYDSCCCREARFCHHRICVENCALLLFTLCPKRHTV